MWDYYLCRKKLFSSLLPTLFYVFWVNTEIIKKHLNLMPQFKGCFLLYSSKEQKLKRIYNIVKMKSHLKIKPTFLTVYDLWLIYKLFLIHFENELGQWFLIRPCVPVRVWNFSTFSGKCTTFCKKKTKYFGTFLTLPKRPKIGHFLTTPQTIWGS